MEMTYGYLYVDELNWSTQADCLVALDAHFRQIGREELVFDEPGFPVVELARSLLVWLDSPNRIDFIFDSMSYEEAGSISIVQDSGGWTFHSVFIPQPLTRPMGWSEVEQCCLNFITKVEADLMALGLHPDEVIRRLRGKYWICSQDNHPKRATLPVRSVERGLQPSEARSSPAECR